jgi:hypothetical protein
MSIIYIYIYIYRDLVGPWEVEEVVAIPCREGRRRFLVRYKGFGPAYDEWKSEQDVSPQLIEEYDELCRLALTGDATAAIYFKLLLTHRI